jgi:hypothetical protein
MIYDKIMASCQRKINRKYNSIPYVVNKLDYPERLLTYDSYWRGLESIILDLIERFDLPLDSCLEFGTEYGYSAAAFANYFDRVTGVDIFTGDIHAGVHDDNYAEITEKLKPWPNVSLVKSDYRDYIKGNDDFHGLIHVDIIHTFQETYECGLWAASHSKCAIFHDTESFPEVKKACYYIAKQTGKKFYNYTKFFGLGIIA